ncbi:MAG TPA: isochorismatase [Armatimonadota bacterium]|jgi:nicotinamidase-related amidase
MPSYPLPLPPHFDPARVGELWCVPYEGLAASAGEWARNHGIQPSTQDGERTCLLVVDAQNTFCLPGFELFVGGRSGHGAVDDMERLCRMLYGNLGRVTQVVATLDTHQAYQVFHSALYVGPDGRPPKPMTQILVDDVRRGWWRVDPQVSLGPGQPSPSELQAHLEHYVEELAKRGRYHLTVWPYHAMLGGVGHALIPAVEAALFFHGQVRRCQPRLEMKGRNPLTESYSVLGPEVLTSKSPTGEVSVIGSHNETLIGYLLSFDRLLVAGEAASHCVAWTLEDLLNAIQERDASLASWVVVLKDCMSSVVVPGVVDYTKEAEEAFARFSQSGMRVLDSTDPRVWE